MKTKNEICVPIRDEKELQQAKEMLERNGEKIDESECYISENKNFNFLRYSLIDNDWFLYDNSDRTEIPLSELESVLLGESESKKQRFELNVIEVLDFNQYSIFDMENEKVVCHLLNENGSDYCIEIGEKIVKLLNEN